MPRALARLVNHMARTGLATDECLRAGSLPLPVHFCSPVPNIPDLDRRQVWTRRSDLGRIDFRTDEQGGPLKELGERFGPECDGPCWPDAWAEDHTFGYLIVDRAQEVAAAFPCHDRARHKSVSGSFWIKRKDRP